jgi:hypothetical protein
MESYYSDHAWNAQWWSCVIRHAELFNTCRSRWWIGAGPKTPEERPKVKVMASTSHLLRSRGYYRCKRRRSRMLAQAGVRENIYGTSRNSTISKSVS